MRLRSLVRPFNWRYALGEVVLIVVGVLIALAASGWYDERERSRTEVALLREIHSNLSADAELIESRLERFHRIDSHIGTLLSYLHSEAPYVDSLDTYFGTAYGYAPAELNTGAYESLKSQGLGLISNRVLRSHVTRVYEQTYRSIQASLEAERDIVLGLMRPYFLRNFENLVFSRSATPLDYDFVASDQRFINLLEYRRQVVQANHIAFLDSGIAEIRALIAALEQELGDV